MDSERAGLFAWWRRQIGSLLPGWARLQFPLQDALIIDLWTLGSAAPVPTATGQILLRRSGQERIAAPLDLSGPNRVERVEGDAVILRLPQNIVLGREITLPAAAGRDLRSLLHFEMDRLTPFDAGEVFWGISEPVRDQSRLKLTLQLVQRQLIDPLLRRLAAIGLEPGLLEVGGTKTLLARLGRQKKPRRIAGYGLCLALVLACLSVPLVSQQVRLQVTENRLKMLMPVQHQIVQLHAQIATLSTAQRLIGQAQRNAGVLQTLALLSGALPDGTWLNDLQVNGAAVAFDGQSSDAAKLISALTATPGLLNVSFSAPTHALSGGADAFSIQLSVSR